MCGRYYIETGFDAKLDGLLRRTHVTRPSADPYQDETRDVCPSDKSLTVHASYDIGGHVMTTAMRWGFANPYGSGLLINARAETALEKKTFAESLLQRRCIVPASGFYEWDAHKARYRFYNANHGLVLLAGFYRQEEDGPHYVILTTEANDVMRPIHDRMPVLLGPKDVHPWIFDESRLEEFLTRKQRSLLCEQDEGQIGMMLGI